MRLIGVRAHDYARDTPEELFAKIAADGWRSVQLAFPKALSGVAGWQDVTPPLVERVAGALAKNALPVAVLGVYVELALADETARQDNVQIFKSQLRVAKALWADCIGAETTSRAKQPGVAQEDAFRALEQSLAQILPEAEALGVTVAMEPVYYHTLSSPELTRRLLCDMQSPALRVIFDPVNLLRPEEVSGQPALWARALEAFGDKIAAVHIKGVQWQGNTLVKAALADSVVDYAGLFDALRPLTQNFSILREEAIPQCAAQERGLLNSLV